MSLSGLQSSVDKLVNVMTMLAMQEAATAPAGDPISPLRNRAYEIVDSPEEGLSPSSRARARGVFRDGAKVKEFLSLGKDPVACVCWLEDEIMRMYHR